ncbi:hypothetical protein GCM10011571_03510 [Marinithermofilum abyssi]|uniref:Uncharacterized protein n=1 Tax=Marinithermofilum abyssi TaxID=1571185 RepID=A0A8J2Y8L1_9BACL|nr:hypothetical protein [Marinithermofilum abyssi]GGE05690.1 hypothetical protein GCM10011571_03510 [Marinithermofilum abyssi]
MIRFHFSALTKHPLSSIQETIQRWKKIAHKGEKPHTKVPSDFTARYSKGILLAGLGLWLAFFLTMIIHPSSHAAVKECLWIYTWTAAPAGAVMGIAARRRNHPHALALLLGNLWMIPSMLLFWFLAVFAYPMIYV